MLEVILTGDYLGTPHDIGAWTYSIRLGREILRSQRGIDRPQSVTCRLAAEAAALAFALEDVARGWEGEELVVRTASAGLEGLLVRRGTGVARDLRVWYGRIRQAAAACASVRVLPARADELAALQERLKDLLPENRLPPTIARASALGALRENRP
jgi:hypothetical protein